MKRFVWVALLALAIAVPAAAQNTVLDDLKVERAKHGTPMPKAELGALLNAVALKHKSEGLGLERKTSGDTCPQPITNIQVACDILRFPGNVGRDVLGDVDGAAVPQWGGPGPANADTFVAPVDTGGVVDPPPPPPPPPTGTATSELQQQQLALLLQVVAGQQQQLEAQRLQAEQLAAAIRDLKAEIAKGVRVRF